MMLTAADDVEANAIPVLPSKRRPPPRSKFARASRLLQHRDPASPPHPCATGVASQRRGVGGAQFYAMAGKVRGAKWQSGVLDERDTSGLGGAGQSQPADKREEFGHYLGPPAEVRAPAAPLRENPLIRKRLVPAVNAVEGRCYGNDREAGETMPSGQDENAEGNSTVSVAVDAKGVLAMPDSVPPNAETGTSQTVTGRSKNARRESRRVAAFKQKAMRVRDEPTLRQAMACIHKERWLEAMLDVLTSLSEHGVFDLCELPPGQKPVSGKGVLKIKRGAQGEIERFKARYVAQGFTQVHVVDFFETWAPVGRYATLRMLLSVCAVEHLKTRHVDINCAFLNGVLEEEGYMVKPPMCNDGSGRFWRLKKVLYGLKQTAREWHRALAKLLSDLGFERCASDPALYVCKVGRCFILLWVEDQYIFNAKHQMQPLVD